MDLVIDQDALSKASSDMKKQCQELSELTNSIQNSFDQLKKEWDTDAGKEFFNRFENDLISNLKKYSTVFEHISENLSSSLIKYEEVFRDADTVANTQY